MDTDTYMESLYWEFCDLSKMYPGTPYSFQYKYDDGGDSIPYFFFNKSLQQEKADEKALEVIDAISEVLGRRDVPLDSLPAVNARSHYVYAESFAKRVCLLVSEGIWDPDKAYSAAIKLVKESANVDSVKLGMLMLRSFENDVTTTLLRLFGLHSDFTLYALVATRGWKRANRFAFDLAQNTIGYGKYAALEFLDPITKDQQEWVFRDAAFNCVLQNTSAILCLLKADIQKYMRSIHITKENFQFFSRNFAYSLEYCEDSPLSEAPIEEQLVKEYLDHAPKYARAFIDFAALVSLKKSTQVTNAPTQYEQDVCGKCFELIRTEKWKYILLNELEQPMESSSLIINALKEYEINAFPNRPYNLTLEEFVPLLDRNDPFDMNVMEYLLLNGDSSATWQSVYEAFSNNMPDSIFMDGPQITKQEELSPQFRPDVWLIFLLKAMIRNKGSVKLRLGSDAERFYIRCLHADFQDIRKEAVSALQSIKKDWSSGTEELLRRHLEVEPDSNVKKRICRLLKMPSASEKEQRYVDISDVAVVPGDMDTRVMVTTIAGAFYRDMSIVEGQLEYGDVLFLKPEPENPYDSNAILVSAEDGYVLGYIPKEENEFLLEMMNRGDKLYAVLKDDIEYYGGRPYIEVWRSCAMGNNGKFISLSAFRESKLKE